VRALLTRRWLGFSALVLVMVAAFVLLGRWQLHRGEARRAHNDHVRANLHAAPLPAQQLLSADRPLPKAQEWRRVSLTGRYDTQHVLVVRNRTLDGRPGFHVLVPLRTDTGAAVLVDRGWVPAGATGRDLPAVPATPDGQVVVTGHARPSEQPHHGSAPPPGQLAAIDVPGIARTLPYPLLDGYVEVAHESPAPKPAPTLLPVPELNGGPHFFYAGQWWTFALIALVGWVVLGRREIADARADAERTNHPSGASRRPGTETTSPTSPTPSTTA
jgi:cytochrome oxidase assembly protein ShyY1